MIYVLNKIVGFLLSPTTLGMAWLIVSAVGLCFTRFRKTGVAIFLASLAWLYFWSIGCTSRMLGLSLEGQWKVVRAEDMPSADAIVLLGGGVICPKNASYPYADLKQGADRAWYAAKLWRAGKAPIVVTSNKGAEKCDNELLMDLGVPKDRIVLETEATTTEENAKYVGKLFAERQLSTANRQRPRILLVTSAYHMRRSLLMFRKYAKDIDVIAAPCDFEITAAFEPLSVRCFISDVGALAYNSALFKEFLGYYGYKWFRR